MTFLLRLTAILSALIIAGCDQINGDSVDHVTSELKRTLEDAKKGVAELTPGLKNVTTEELGKIFSFEYKILDIKDDPLAAEIEATLNVLGRERWECFAVQPVGSGIRLFLRRRPASYLQYIPRVFP